ncbi:MAG: hypothetical protein LUE96_00275 [Lachnospiraceae bacterium]|nr:hypothetical protein [Lachnospiraceae bacterium]
MTACEIGYIINKKRIWVIEVAFFKSTFSEMSGIGEEKGKERTPKGRAA